MTISSTIHNHFSLARLHQYTDPTYRPSPDEIRRALRHAGLTGSKAGDLLGVSGRTIRKWTGGEQAMPHAAWLTLIVYVYDAEIPYAEPMKRRAAQQMVGSLIRSRIASDQNIGYWEKSCLIGAIGALQIGWIRLSMAQLAKADVPRDERNEDYVPRDPDVASCTREQLTAMLSEFVVETGGPGTIVQT